MFGKIALLNFYIILPLACCLPSRLNRRVEEPDHTCFILLLLVIGFATYARGTVPQKSQCYRVLPHPALNGQKRNLPLTGDLSTSCQVSGVLRPRFLRTQDLEAIGRTFGLGGVFQRLLLSDRNS